MPETDASVIPQLRQVFRLTKGELDALAGLRDGALGFATDTGILYRQNGDGAANWEAITALVDYPMKVQPTGNRWTIPGYAFGSMATRAVGANIIFYIPIFIEEITTYIRIGLEVTTFVAGTIDIRIFNWEQGLPTSLVLNCGTVDCGTNGLKEITINQELPRGYYFLAYRTTVTPTLRCPDEDHITKSPVAGLSLTGNVTIINGVLAAIAAYADPAPAPSQIYAFNRVCLTLREN